MTDNPHPALQLRSVWLDESIWQEAETARIVERLIALLCDSDIPLHRVNIAVSSLHPEIVGFAHVWKRGTNRVESLAGTRAFVLSPEVYDRSPFRIVNEEGASGIRRRLERDDCLDDLDILAELREDGATDYVVMAIGKETGGGGTFTTWTTSRPGGFTTAELVAIAEHVRMLSHVLSALAQRETARNIVNTYVGSRAGTRILAGEIVRGRGSDLEAAIWLSDIRDFTGLSERLPANVLLAQLNRHFDALIKPVQAHGGEVLKLMGDAILAVFPAESPGDAASACAAALAAAREARETNAATLSGDADDLRYAVALHYGTVSYGNVGASNRLDFTVIGPAVNLVSRLNALAKHLDRDILLSEAFAARSAEPAEPLGTHTLRGLAGAYAVFAPSAATA